jgi:hypothetical protein
VTNTREPQNIGPESKPDTGMKAISATGPVGLAFTIVILLIFLTGIHPARWFLAASIAIGIATIVILRFTNRR